MRETDGGDDELAGKRLTLSQRRNSHSYWIGCSALPVLSYVIVRVLIALL